MRLLKQQLVPAQMILLGSQRCRAETLDSKAQVLSKVESSREHEDSIILVQDSPNPGD